MLSEAVYRDAQNDRAQYRFRRDDRQSMTFLPPSGRQPRVLLNQGSGGCHNYRSGIGENR
jgi:hypothetical protein